MLSSSDSAVLASSVLPGWLDPETLLNQAGNWAMWVAIAIIFSATVSTNATRS